MYPNPVSDSREIEKERNGKIKKLKFDAKSPKEAKNQTFMEFVFFLMVGSSVLALSRLGQAQTKKKRAFWLLVLVGSFMGCCYEVHDFLTVYFQYPVIIDKMMVEEPLTSPFPAVTVCNLNRMKKEYYHYTMKTHYKYIKDNVWKKCFKYLYPENEIHCFKKRRSLPKRRTKRNYRTTHSQRKMGTRLNYESPPFLGKYQIEYNEFLNAYFNIEPKCRKFFGYQVEEMVKSCSFNYRVCTSKNFTYFHNTQFGNCYTFKNTSPNQYQRDIQSLDLYLYVNLSSYMALTQAAGFRVVVHDPNEDPNPSEDGVNISPGFETLLSMSTTTVQRLPYPYKDHCHSYNRTSIDIEQRSQFDCIRICQQRTSLSICGCVDPAMSSETSFSMTQCDLKDITQTRCLDDVLEDMSDNVLPCACPLPCFMTTYNLQISSSALAKNLMYFDRSFERVRDPECEIEDSFTDIENFSFFYSSNINSGLGYFGCFISRKNVSNPLDCLKFNYTPFNLSYLPVLRYSSTGSFKPRIKPFKTYSKLKVFFSTREHFIYTQRPMFNDSEFLAHLGGILGLWLGLSLVSAFQCVEGFFLLLSYFFQQSKH